MIIYTLYALAGRMKWNDGEQGNVKETIKNVVEFSFENGQDKTFRNEKFYGYTKF